MAAVTSCTLHASLVCSAAPSALNYDAHPYPGLTADCGTHLTLWVLVDLDVDLDLDLDVDPDYPVRHELSQA
jgi:hypothetical protein